MPEEKTNAIAVVNVELPEPVAKRGINEAQWRTLCNSLYPGANPKSVLLVLDYCASRNLDPMKKPVHIVPMRVKNAQSGEYEWRDVVMPGVYEHRITAQRTGEYLGHSKPGFGPDIEFLGVKAPEWCEMTMYRWNRTANQRVEFPVRVYFREVVATSKDRKTNIVEVNDRWTRAPIQMLTKCTEAAGTREAFPEEVGGEPTAEEMDGQHVIEATAVPSVPSAWERVPEALRDNLERAFTVLKLSEAQRLVRLNEYITADADPTEAVERLLIWCGEELTRSLRPPKPDNSNKKVTTPAPAATPAPAVPEAVGVPGGEGHQPAASSGGDTKSAASPSSPSVVGVTAGAGSSTPAVIEGELFAPWL